MSNKSITSCVLMTSQAVLPANDLSDSTSSCSARHARRKKVVYSKDVISPPRLIY